MRIIHLPASYLPYYTGGKEVFVSHLATELNKMGHDNLVVIHADDRIPADVKEYQYNGVTVKVLPPVRVNHLQYWQSKASIDDSFEQLLMDYRPDVVHFHDQSGAASLSHLHIVKKMGIKSVVTYHSPGQSCPQRSLLYRGKFLCDGKLDVRRCSECLYSYKGLPAGLAKVLSWSPLQFKNIESNKIKRFLSIPTLVQQFITSFHEIYSMHDGIQIYAHWVKPMLLSNGVNSSKIFYAEQLIPAATEYDTEKNNEKFNSQVLNLLFTGRCTYIKGIHVLVEAIKLLPEDFPVEVHFLGPYWDSSEYGRNLLKKISNDKRFRKPQLIPPSKVLSYMQQMDAVVVPSLWPETGPFVVLEAFRAGVPVVGTRAAGIAQRVKHLQNGLLFEWGNARDLANCIKLLYERKKTGQAFEVPQLPDVSLMAQQIQEIYLQL